MTPIEFTKEEKEIVVRRIQRYFSEELEQEIGGFDAQFLLEFFAEAIGTYFYNRGLYDAQALLEKRMDTISDAIYGLEKPTEFRR